jgi:superfamily II DNA or RNA helicase
VTLRPRQQKAIADLQAAYRAGHKAPVLIAPTGFGKTHTAVSIIESAIQRGNRVWFLAHLAEILNDTTARLTKASIPHGQIRAGHPSEYHHPVQVVSLQTAVRRTDLPRPDLIIIDECHLAVASSYRKIVEATGNPPLLGLTGTPERLDGRGLGEIFDVLVPTCFTAELIADKLLAPVQVYSFPAPQGINSLDRRAGDYDQGQAAKLLDRPAIVGDALDHWQRLCHGRRGVAFCSTVAHAQSVAEQWRAAGYSALAVSGGSDDAERREAIDGLRAGRLDFVACAQLWIAGVDVPEIDAVVWLRPTQSVTAWLQGIGRGLRIAPGKQNLIVMDHCGNTHRLGFPTDHREWSLEGRQKRQAEAAPSVRTCPECYAALPTTTQVCPCCGHEFTAEENLAPRQVDGELTLLVPKGYRIGDPVGVSNPDHDALLKHNQSPPQNLHGVWYVASDPSVMGWVRIGRDRYDVDAGAYWVHMNWLSPVTNHKAPRPSSRARTLEELQEVGRRLGYKPGWAHRVYAARRR